MKYKVKVKKMSIESAINHPSYHIVFDICDKISVAGQQFGLGVDDKSSNLFNYHQNAVLNVMNIEEKMFDFISAHAKETLIVTIEKHNIASNRSEEDSDTEGDNCDKENNRVLSEAPSSVSNGNDQCYDLIGVELIYG